MADSLDLTNKDNSNKSNKNQVLNVNKGNENNKVPNYFTKFNWRTYLGFNKDLIPHIKSEKDAINHYEKHGQYENRLRSFIEFYDKFPYFNCELYRQTHNDLHKLNREDLISHYWYNGQYENRITTDHIDILNSVPNLDFNFYRKYYADLQNSNMTDSELLAHYLVTGRKQNRLKNSFELAVENFLDKHDRYSILFSRIEDVLVNIKPIKYIQLSDSIKDLDSDIYTDLTTELNKFYSKVNNNPVNNNRNVVFVIDFYLNLRSDEYKKSYQIADNVNTIFSQTSLKINDQIIDHFYIRTENLAVIDRIMNPDFIYVRGNNLSMIQKLGTLFNNSTKIYYPATSLTYQKNKLEKNAVQAANYQLYINAATSIALNTDIKNSNDSNVEVCKKDVFTGYDIILVDDRHIYDYMNKMKIVKSKLVLFTKYAVKTKHNEKEIKDKDKEKEKDKDKEKDNDMMNRDKDKGVGIDKDIISKKFDLLYTSYAKGPTKNFNIVIQFVKYLAEKKSTLTILILNKDNNDYLDQIRQINYPFLTIVNTSTPDLYYDLCSNHLITSGRDAQPRTITETLSKGVHNIVLDTLTNGVYIFRDTKIFGTIIPTKKVYKGKHYIPVSDNELFEKIESYAFLKQNRQRIMKLSYDNLNREKLLFNLVSNIFTMNSKYVVTFATIDYSNMVSLLINSIIKTNRDAITIVFCINWEPSHHQLFVDNYRNYPILFIPYSLVINSKNDILKLKVQLIKEVYAKLHQNFIWVDADSIVLQPLNPLYNLLANSDNDNMNNDVNDAINNNDTMNSNNDTMNIVNSDIVNNDIVNNDIANNDIANSADILVFTRLDSQYEFEKVALGAIGFSKNSRVEKFIDIWSKQVETFTSLSQDWFADQIGFYRSLLECRPFLRIYNLKNTEHSINGEENTIIYSRRRHNKRSICDLAYERNINSDMLLIPGVKYAYINQTVDHYSLFFVTYDYPSNGGAATNLYAIYKLYREMGVTACIAFINDSPVPEALLNEFKRDSNIFFYTSDKINLDKPKSILKTKKFKVLIFKIYKTLELLEQNNLQLNLFKKIIYLCSGLSTYKPILNKTGNVDSYSAKRLEELYPIEKSHKVIFNSKLTESLYLQMVSEIPYMINNKVKNNVVRADSMDSFDTEDSIDTLATKTDDNNGDQIDKEDNDLADVTDITDLTDVTDLKELVSNNNSNNKKVSVLNTTLLGMCKDDFINQDRDKDNDIKWNERDIDCIYVVSDCHRKVKNADLVYQLYKRPELSQLKKVIIGLNADLSLNKIENTTIINGNLNRSEVIKYLKKSKILVLPSHFDSSPNILYEALFSGCNVIASSNIGNIEIIPNQNIIKLEQNSALNAKKFAAIVQKNLVKRICKEPTLNADTKKILDDLILL